MRESQTEDSLAAELLAVSSASLCSHYSGEQMCSTGRLAVLWRLTPMLLPVSQLHANDHFSENAVSFFASITYLLLTLSRILLS